MAELSEAVFSSGDVMRRIAALEAQVREMQAGRRLEAATIGQGGITLKGGSVKVVDNADNLLIQLGLTGDGRRRLQVNDDTGAPKIRAGELDSGGYGLEAVDPNGKTVKLADLVFGFAIGEALSQQSTASTNWTDLTGNPSVTINVGSTGKVLVLFSAQIGWLIGAPGSVGGYAGVDVSGATSLPLSGATESDRQLRVQAEFGGATTSTMLVGAGSMKFFTGLNPGSTTFKLRYRSRFGQQIDFDNRIICAIPF